MFLQTIRTPNNLIAKRLGIANRGWGRFVIFFISLVDDLRNPHSNLLPTICEAILVMIGRTISLSVNNNFKIESIIVTYRINDNVQ
jgi:hypothetical protein